MPEDGADDEVVDATLTVAGAGCEVTAAQVTDYDGREVSITLSEDGLREFITELRLEEYDSDAAAWLADHSTADMSRLSGVSNE